MKTNNMVIKQKNIDRLLFLMFGIITIALIIAGKEWIRQIVIEEVNNIMNERIWLICQQLHG